MERKPKRVGRKPKPPSQLVAQTGSFAGEHATFSLEDITVFAKRHGLEGKIEGLYQAFLWASDSLQHANELREHEPTPRQWKKAFKDLSKSLGEAMELLGLADDRPRSGRARYDTQMLERAAFAAHRGLFNVRENKLPDRNMPEWDLGADLLSLGHNSNSIFEAIKTAPNVLRTLQIAAELAAIDPMPIKTPQNGPFAHLVIEIYERFTGKEADLGSSFLTFLTGSGNLLGHWIAGESAKIEMVRDALRDRRHET